MYIAPNLYRDITVICPIFYLLLLNLFFLFWLCLLISWSLFSVFCLFDAKTKYFIMFQIKILSGFDLSISFNTCLAAMLLIFLTMINFNLKEIFCCFKLCCFWVQSTEFLITLLIFIFATFSVRTLFYTFHSFLILFSFFNNELIGVCKAFLMCNQDRHFFKFPTISTWLLLSMLLVHIKQ